MKTHLQDMTVYAVSILAVVALYTIGYTLGISSVIGIQYWLLMLPQSTYEAAALVSRGIDPLFIVMLSLVMAMLLSFWLNPRGIIIAIIICFFGFLLAFYIGDNYGFPSLPKYGAIALIVAAFISTNKKFEFHQISTLLVLTGFFCFVVIGLSDGKEQTKELLASDKRVHIIAEDRNYVNARLIRSTTSGIVIASGKDIIYYPMDKIVRITAAMPDKK